MIKIYGEEVNAVLECLMQGGVTCAVTASDQGLIQPVLDDLVAYIDPKYPIRVEEKGKELDIRAMYPDRNVISVHNTAVLTAEEMCESTKLDGFVYLAGVINNDNRAYRMIQSTKIAADFSLFGHYATTTSDLVVLLQNALKNAGGVYSLLSARELVLDTVKVNIHLNYRMEFGHFIERITEIVPNKRGCTYVNVVHWDIEKGKGMYFSENRFSYELEDHIKSKNPEVWNKLDKLIRNMR